MLVCTISSFSDQHWIRNISDSAFFFSFLLCGRFIPTLFVWVRPPLLEQERERKRNEIESQSPVSREVGGGRGGRGGTFGGLCFGGGREGEEEEDV